MRGEVPKQSEGRANVSECRRCLHAPYGAEIPEGWEISAAPWGYRPWVSTEGRALFYKAVFNILHSFVVFEMALRDDAALAIRLDILQELVSDIRDSPVFKKFFRDRVLENMVLVVKENDAAFAELKSKDLSEADTLEIREEMMRILEEHVKKHI